MCGRGDVANLVERALVLEGEASPLQQGAQCSALTRNVRHPCTCSWTTHLAASQLEHCVRYNCTAPAVDGLPGDPARLQPTTTQPPTTLAVTAPTRPAFTTTAVT